MLSAINRHAASGIHLVLGGQTLFKVGIDLPDEVINLALKKVVCAGDFDVINDNSLLRSQTLIQLVDIRLWNHPISCSMQQKSR